MRVFLDTNVLLDAIVARDNKTLSENAATILSLGEANVVDLSMSVLSVPTIAYVLKNMTADAKRSIIRSLAGIVNILPANSEHVSDMLDGTMHDIEDTLQVQSATEGSCDLIVTRNVKDFHPCPLPVISPAEFLKRVLA